MSNYNINNMDWYSGPSSTSPQSQNYDHNQPQQVQQFMPQVPTNDSFSPNFEDEPPLLEELGIDIPGILKRTQSIILLRFHADELNELDMGGPLIIATLMGTIHLLMGKLHFGIILGWSVVSSCIMFFVTNQLAGEGNPDAGNLILYSICCLLGYCMIPIVILSAISLIIPGKGLIHIISAIVCVLWSTYAACKFFVKRSSCFEDLKALIAYPCFLIYMIFAVLTLY